MTEISRVGPKGYIHGWIFTGAPGVGAEVFHPHHGHGTVTAHNGAQATVRFHKSGNEHKFSARQAPGKPRLEAAGVRDTITHAKMRVDQIEKRLDYHAAKSVHPGLRPVLSGMRDELGKSHPDVAKLKAGMDKLEPLLKHGGSRGPNRDQELIAFYNDLSEAIDGIHYLRTTPVAQRHAAFIERTRALCSAAGLDLTR